jgi:hypothetical protein
VVHAGRRPVAGALVDVAGAAADVVAPGSVTVSLTDDGVDLAAPSLEAGEEGDEFSRVTRVDTDGYPVGRLHPDGVVGAGDVAVGVPCGSMVAMVVSGVGTLDD